MQNAKGKDIPELRIGAHTSDVLDMNWLDLAMEERRLVHQEHLIGGNQNEIVRPVDVRLDDIEEHEDHPYKRENCDQHSNRPVVVPSNKP